MKHAKDKAYRIQIAISVILAVVVFVAIASLYISISSDLLRLKSARSDNVQWNLSQAEVEFLEYEINLSDAVKDQEPNLAGVRRSFDIFYSRIMTFHESSVYSSLREVEAFSNSFTAINAFLEQSVTLIDADDSALILSLDNLSNKTREVRNNVRELSNSGLNFFATEADERRSQVSETLTQMTVAIAILTLALLLFAFYLSLLNRQNLRRRREVIQASKRMDIVTSTALDAVIVCDTAGVVLDFNAAAEQIFGYASTDAIGQDLGELIVPDKYRGAHDIGMQRMRDNGEKRVVGKGRIKLEAKRANGEEFPMEFSIQSAETHEGEFFVSFLRDISYNVAAEKELVAARDRALAGEKSKTDFLATMSHEIRTPLNGLLGNLTLLGDTALSEKQARYIKNMETSGKLLMSHISDVLDITKYDAGKLQLRPIVMNVSTLLQDIVDNQSGAATAKNTTLSWEWGDAVTDWVLADKDRLQHILMNIIGNAVKFTRDGQVMVTACVLGDVGKGPYLQIKIVDTGRGMSAELKEQIFDDFMTGDSAYDRDVGGTGLGLGIARRFVKAMGGSIEVESEEGVGSTFFVRIPITPAEAPARQKQHSKMERSTRSSHILLVEDNEINRIVAREMLAAAGHTVTEAHNGKAAVEATQLQTFDLILMDISMPVMDGRAATRTIRSSGTASSNTPIIALTANAMAEEQKAFLADGMNAILTKPLSRDSLLDVLSQYVEGAATGQECQLSDREPILLEKQNLQELLDTLGAEALQPVLDRFEKDVDETITYLGQYAEQPLPEIASHAHKIAGSAAALGAIELRALLVKVENAAKRGELAGIKEAVDALPSIWDATRALIKMN